MLKEDVNHKWFTGRVFTSAGIGRGYVFDKKRFYHKFRGKDTKPYYITEQGQQIAMPGYYKRKIYTDEQREFLWKIAQEDEYTYVHGEKVRKEDESTIKNLEEYYRKRTQQDMFDNPKEWEKRKKGTIS